MGRDSSVSEISPCSYIPVKNSLYGQAGQPRLTEASEMLCSKQYLTSHYQDNQSHNTM